jgi:moderate conductance mechanosensitive channel
VHDAGTFLNGQKNATSCCVIGREQKVLMAVKATVGVILPHFYDATTASTSSRGSALQQLSVLFLRLVFAGLLIGIAARGASGEGLESSSHAPPSQGSAVTPEQARQALEVLQDESKRAQTVEILQAIAGAAVPMQNSSITNAPVPATIGAKEPGVLANEPEDRASPDGLGAQMLIQVSEWIGAISENIQAAARTVTHFPVLWRWVEETASDPYARDRVVDAVWKLFVVLGFALMLEWLSLRGLQRPSTALESLAEQVCRKQEQPVAETVGSASGNAAQSARSWRLLQRLPFAIAHLLLDLLPVLVFAVSGSVLLGTPLGTPIATRLVILAVIHAYVMCRLIMCVTRTIILPRGQRFRFLKLRDETAAYIEVWVKRIVIVAVFGIAIAQVARLLGLHRGGYAALVRMAILVVHLFLVIILLQCRRAVADLIRAPEARGAFAALRNRLADFWHLAAIFFVMGLWVVWAMRVQNGYALILQYFFATVGVLIAARLATIVAVGGLDRIFRISPEIAMRFPTLEAHANRYYPALRGAVFAVIATFTVLVLLEVWGIHALRWFEAGQVGNRLLSSFVTVVVASTIALVIWEVANTAIDRHLAQLSREARHSRMARLRTLLPMLRTTLLVAIVVVVGLTALSEIGVNITPLLAGAGIVGVAIGFGSQKLVQDVITGIFLLLENAMQVGDYVTVSGLSGKVENLSIRSIRLRANDGSVHIIPFSAVTSVTNTNRGIGNASISINVAYKEDTDRVGEVLKDIAAEIRQDPDFKSLIRGDLALWGVDKIDAGMVTILGQIECTDAGRWSVQREFNRRMKKRFQELGIEIAAPPAMMVVQPLVPHREIDGASGGELVFGKRANLSHESA